MYSEKMYKFGDNACLIRTISEQGAIKKKELGAENVYDFSIGNPSVPSPVEVRKAMIDILQNEDPIAVHSYTSAVGLEGARKAIADDLNRRYSTDYTAENFFITNGASTSLVCSVRAVMTDHDSEIIGIAPYFMDYKVITESNEGKFVLLPPDTENFQINFDLLEKAINKNTRGVIINSPNNPSGVIYTEETLNTLSTLLKKKSDEFGHIIYLISDEPYREICFNDSPVPFTALYYDNTIVCYSYSKSLSLPGERIGYILVPSCVKDWKKVLLAVAGAARASGFICAPSLMQKVIARCASVTPDISVYRKNRDLLMTELSKIGYEYTRPDGAFYMFVKAPGGDSVKFCETAMKYNLLIVPGTEFGCPSHMRVAYCVDHEMIKRSIPAFRKAYEETVNG